MSLNKSPSELSIGIITKQNSIDYLNTEECGQIIERCKARMIQNSIREFKNKFPLNEEFYQHIHKIQIEKGSHILNIILNDDNYFSFIKFDDEVRYRHHCNSKNLFIKNCVELFENNAAVDLNDSYDFFINLLAKNKENVLIFDF